MGSSCFSPSTEHSLKKRGVGSGTGNNQKTNQSNPTNTPKVELEPQDKFSDMKKYGNFSSLFIIVLRGSNSR